MKSNYYKSVLCAALGTSFLLACSSAEDNDPPVIGLSYPDQGIILAGNSPAANITTGCPQGTTPNMDSYAEILNRFDLPAMPTDEFFDNAVFYDMSAERGRFSFSAADRSGISRVSISMPGLNASPTVTPYTVHSPADVEIQNTTINNFPASEMFLTGDASTKAILIEFTVDTFMIRPEITISATDASPNANSVSQTVTLLPTQMCS